MSQLCLFIASQTSYLGATFAGYATPGDHVVGAGVGVTALHRNHVHGHAQLVRHNLCHLHDIGQTVSRWRRKLCHDK